MASPSHAHGFWRIWTAPLVLAAIIVLGLTSALLGEHIVWKALAWIGLGVPVLTAGWFAARCR
jgi:hypothetical protein